MNSSEDEVANLCLMAHEYNYLLEVSSSHCDLNNDEPSYYELEKAFYDLFDESKKSGAKISILKRLLASTTLEKENEEKALNILKNEHELLNNDFKTQKETFEKDKNVLSSKVDDLTNLKGKGFASTKLLYDFVNNMKPHKETNGIGYDSLFFNKSQTPKAKINECSTSYYNSHNLRETKNAPKRPSLTCHYCSKVGQHISRCLVKKNPSK